MLVFEKSFYNIFVKITFLYMGAKKVDKIIHDKVLLKKNENSKVIVKEFKKDSLLDKLLVELIEAYKKLRQLKNLYKDLPIEKIPIHINIEIKYLESYTFGISTILTS